MSFTLADIENATQDPQSWRNGLAPDASARLESILRDEPDPKAGLQKLLSIGYTASVTGESPMKVAKNWDGWYRTQFAVAPGGLALADAPKDDGEFFSALQGLVKARREQDNLAQDAQVNGTIAASLDENLFDSVANWQAQAKGNPQYKPEMLQHFVQAYGRIGQMRGKYGNATDQYMEALQREQQGKTKDGDDVLMQQFRDTLIDMPAEDRSAVLEMMGNKARKLGDKQDMGVLRSMGEGLARFVTADTSLDEGALEGVSTKPGRVTTQIPVITTPAEAWAFVKEQADHAEAQAFSALSSSGGAGMGYIPPTGEERELTADEAKLVATAKERAQKAIEVGRHIRAIAHETDPTGPKAATFGTSLGLMGMLGVGGSATLPIAARLYTANDYDQLRLEHPDIPAAKARGIALASGLAEAALDQWDIHIFNNLPNVRALLSGGLKRELIATAGKEFLGGTLAENLQEAAQDAVLPILTNALAHDAPSVNWKEDLADYAQGRVDTFFAMWPLVAIGSGVATLRNYHGSRIELLNDQRLGESGFIQTDREHILNTARAGSDAEVEKAIQDAMPRRMPEVAAEFGGEAQAQRMQMQRTIAKAEALGMLPRIRRDGQGFSLHVGEKSVKVESWDQAQAMALGHLTDYERQQQRAIAAVAGELIDRGTAPEAWEQSPYQDRNVQHEVDAGHITEAEAREAVQVANQLDGLGADEADLSATAVLGKNTAEMVDTVRTLVSRGYQQGSVLTPIEEVIEGRWKEGLANGIYTHEQGKAWVRMAEQAMGESLLPADREATKRELLEAISKIVVADVVGRRKDGSHFAPGLISQGLAAQALGYRQRAESAAMDANAQEVGKFRAFLRAWRALIGQAMRRGLALMKARAEGKLGEDYDSFLDGLLGVADRPRLASAAESGGGYESSGETSYSLGPFSPLSFVLRRWKERLERWLQTGEAGREPIHLGPTPAVLQVAGAEGHGLVVPPGLFAKVTKDRHGVPIEALRALPEALADPVAVFQSRTHADSLLVLTEFHEPGAGPILAAITLDKRAGRDLIVNEVASLYGKSTATIMDMFNEQPLYVNKEKSQAWTRRAGSQESGRGTPTLDRLNVPGPAEVVKWAEQRRRGPGDQGQGPGTTFSLTPGRARTETGAALHRQALAAGVQLTAQMEAGLAAGHPHIIAAVQHLLADHRSHSTGAGAPNWAHPAHYRTAEGRLQIPPHAPFAGEPAARVQRLAAAEDAFLQKANDTAAFDQAYDALPDAQGGKVISADTARELEPHYARDRDGALEYLPATLRVANTYAWDRLARELQTPRGEGRLVLLMGGWGAGKTHTLAASGIQGDLIFDSALRDLGSARDIIETARQNGWKQVDVVYVQRPLDLVTEGALDRAYKEGRPVPLDELPKVHRESQETAVNIADYYRNDAFVKNSFLMNDGTVGTPLPIKSLTYYQIAPGGEYHYDEQYDGLAKSMVEENANSRKAAGDADRPFWEAATRGFRP